MYKKLAALCKWFEIIHSKNKGDFMMELIKIGYNWIHNNSKFFTERPFGIPDYELILFRSKVNLYHKKETILITSPAIFIYIKNTPQKYGCADEMLLTDWFQFNSDMTNNNENEIELLLKLLNIPVQTPIYISDIHTISELIKDLRYEYRQSGLYQKYLIDAKIRNILCKIACIYHQQKDIPQYTNKYFNTFVNIKNRIHSNHGVDTIEKLAKEVHISVSYFHYIYKSIFKSSPYNDIIKSRLSYACHLLRGQDISIAEVAEKCRYSNVEHFIRQFKQYMKCTPQKYKNDPDKNYDIYSTKINSEYKKSKNYKNIEPNKANDEFYTIIHYYGKVIDIYAGSADEGTPAITYSNTGAVNQIFNFEKLLDGSYKIAAVHSNLVLSPETADNGAKIVQQNWDGNDLQKWYIYPVENEWIKITNAKTGYCLYASHDKYEDSQEGYTYDIVYQFIYNATYTQFWKLKKF